MDIEEFKFDSTAIGRREVEYVEGPEW